MGRDARGNLRGLPGGPGLIGAGGGRISTQPAEIWDAYNRKLLVGDLLQLHTGLPTIFRVMKVERVLESGVPDGIMEIEVMARLKFRAPRAQPNMEFVRILEGGEVESSAPPQEQESPDPIEDSPVEDAGTIVHVDGFSGDREAGS